MIYFGVEIFDGKPWGGAEFKLDINKKLEDQWVHLSYDIAYIQYLFKSIEISIGIDYTPPSGPVINPEGYFVLEVTYVNNTSNSLDYLKIFFSRDLFTLQKHLQLAVDFVMLLKEFNHDQIQELVITNTDQLYNEFLKR